MKLNLYIIKIIRKIQKTIGKKETLVKIKITRGTLHRWQVNEYPVPISNVDRICSFAAALKDEDGKKVFEEDFKALFMQALYFIMQDHEKPTEEN
jgi:hypothetical protein